MRSLLLIFICSAGVAHAQTTDWSTSISLGHQGCLAEGGAACSEKEDGLSTAIAVDYAVWSWMDVGIESGFGFFPGSDGYKTLSVFGVLSVNYFISWLDVNLVGDFGGGVLNVSHTRPELSVGDVSYDYTSVSALRFGGGLTYDLNKRYTVGLLSHLVMGGTGEVCTEISGRAARCSDNQDLIDLWTTSAKLTYHF